MFGCKSTQVLMKTGKVKLLDTNFSEQLILHSGKTGRSVSSPQGLVFPEAPPGHPGARARGLTHRRCYGKGDDSRHSPGFSRGCGRRGALLLLPLLSLRLREKGCETSASSRSSPRLPRPCPSSGRASRALLELSASLAGQPAPPPAASARLRASGDAVNRRAEAAPLANGRFLLGLRGGTAAALAGEPASPSFLWESCWGKRERGGREAPFLAGQRQRQPRAGTGVWRPPGSPVPCHSHGAGTSLLPRVPACSASVSVSCAQV